MFCNTAEELSEYQESIDNISDINPNECGLISNLLGLDNRPIVDEALVGRKKWRWKVRYCSDFV